MTTWNLQRVREVANKKLKEDTKLDDIELSNMEFDLYFMLLNIAKDINEWKFYLSDDVVDEFIVDTEYYSAYIMECTIDECLEDMKTVGDIEGFLELGNDLWLIKE